MDLGPGVLRRSRVSSDAAYGRWRAFARRRRRAFMLFMFFMVRALLDSYPTNLYPIPCTVRTYCGCLAFGSIFCRSHATCTSTVRVDGIE